MENLSQKEMRSVIIVIISMFTGHWLLKPGKQKLSGSTGQKISFHFDYPELVKISTWEKMKYPLEGL